MRAALLDAGPIVAYLRQDDVHHRAAVAAVERCGQTGLALVTTWEAISEAYTVIRSRARSRRGGFEAALVLDWAEASGVLLEAALPADQLRCHEVLRRHSALSLSYADALLLAVGERLEVAEILTTDGAHFPAVSLKGATVVSVVE